MFRVLTIGLLLSFVAPNFAQAQRRFFQRQDQQQHHHYCPHCQQNSSAAGPVLVEGTNGAVPVVDWSPVAFGSPEVVPVKAVAEQAQENSQLKAEPVALPVSQSEVQDAELEPSDEAVAVAQEAEKQQPREAAEEQSVETTQQTALPVQLGSLPDGAAFTRAAEAATEVSDTQLWQGRMFSDATYELRDETVCAAAPTRSQDAVASNKSEMMGFGWLLPFGLLPLGWLAFALRGSRDHAVVQGGAAAVTTKQVAAADVEADKSLFVKDDFECGVLKNGNWETSGATMHQAIDQEPIKQNVTEPKVNRHSVTATSGYGSLGIHRPKASLRNAPVEANERTPDQDDFMVIDGICTKTECLLYDAEIESYTDLSETDDKCRMNAMIPGGSRYSSKDTRHWPEAARELIPVVEETQEGYAIAVGDEALQGDDLTLIEGICPEAQQLLYDAGIYSYSDVARTDTETIANALACGGSRFESVDTARWASDAEACVEPEFESVFLRFGTEAAECRSLADDGGDWWLADESFGDIELDDLTQIDSVDEAAQQAIYSAGVFEFGDLAVANRDDLKRSMVEHDSKYASFDVDRCCEEAMDFVPENFWQGEEGEEVQLQSEVNDANQKTGSKSLWDSVSDGVKRGKATFAAKMEELDGNAEHLLTRDGSTDLEKALTARAKSCWNVVSNGVKRGKATFAAKMEELDGNAEHLLTRDGSTDLEKALTARAKSCWNVVNNGVKRGNAMFTTKMKGIDAQLRSYASDSCESELDGVSAGSGQRDDLTKIDIIDEDTQEAIYSAGVFEFGDLAVADRVSLKRAMVDYDPDYASFDADRCCDQAMHFVSEDFWHSEEGEGLRVLSELNDMTEEMTRFKSLWSAVSERVKRGSKKAFAKVGGEE